MIDPNKKKQKKRGKPRSFINARTRYVKSIIFNLGRISNRLFRFLPFERLLPDHLSNFPSIENTYRYR